MIASVETAFPRREIAAKKCRGGRMTMLRRFIHHDDTEMIERWRHAHNNTGLFMSHARFAEPDPSSDIAFPLIFDFDARDDVDKAREEVLCLASRLWHRLSIPRDAVDVHYSGAKGFHVTASLKVFDDIVSQRLVFICRAVARRLAREGFECIDTSIYDKRRLIRLVNSRHERTGLYKIALSWSELETLSMREIRSLAGRPRPTTSFAHPRPIPEAGAWLRGTALVWDDQQRRRHRARRTLERARGLQMPHCASQIEERAVLPDGSRHQIYLALARLHALLGLHPEQSRNRLLDLDARNPTRDGDDYLRRLVYDVQQYPGFKGCPNPVLNAYCDPTRCPLAGRGSSRGSDGAQTEGTDESTTNKREVS